MIIFYAFGGSDNHGCEALLRGTCSILQQKARLYSNNLRADVHYNVDALCEIKTAACKYYYKPWRWLLGKIASKVLGYNPMMELIRGKENGVYLSVGGDNYCYPGLIEPVTRVNKRIRAHGHMTVLWGASVEEKDLDNEKILQDISGYDYIFARESLSYNALCERGLQKKTFLYPDPAFAMCAVKTEIPKEFKDAEVIGINVSPLILKYASNEKILLDGCLALIRYILENTECKIALFAHVVKKNNHDMEILRRLQHEANSNRIFEVSDRPADELKKCIAACSFFVGARTHATIAAYSSCVPTLVLGYSVKALGIAKDLFGKSEDYVLDVRNLKNSNDVVNAFVKLYENRMEIRSHLEKCIPIWEQRAREAGIQLNKCISGEHQR